MPKSRSNFHKIRKRSRTMPFLKAKNVFSKARLLQCAAARRGCLLLNSRFGRQFDFGWLFSQRRSQFASYHVNHKRNRKTHEASVVIDRNKNQRDGLRLSNAANSNISCSLIESGKLCLNPNRLRPLFQILLHRAPVQVGAAGDFFKGAVTLIKQSAISGEHGVRIP